jgi:hypothetical protein
MHWRLIAERTDTGDIDRVVATQNDRNRNRLKNLTNSFFDIGVALFGIGVDNIGIANIGDPATGKIGYIILMVMGACMAESE